MTEFVSLLETLFAPTSTPQRKYWGFEVVSKALPLLPEKMLPLVFTQNFMKCWMNHLSGEDRYLHKAAQRIVGKVLLDFRWGTDPTHDKQAKQVQDITKTNSLVGFALLSQLLGKNGSRSFDKVTKTKTVENIMGNLNTEGVQQYIDFLTKLILDPAETEE
jgi:DNA polymerase phi